MKTCTGVWLSIYVAIHSTMNRRRKLPAAAKRSNRGMNPVLNAGMSAMMNPDQLSQSHIPSMDSPTLLKNLEEKFFLCSICCDLFKEPKLLPCLHRYCGDCLNAVFQASDVDIIQCPMCRFEICIPKNGVEGIKTDFLMKSVVEFIQVQKELEKANLQKCVSCLQLKNVSTYCFKCSGFLCDCCTKFHMDSTMFVDHQQRILTMNNIGEMNLTLEDLATLTESPRCRTHVEENAKLCCVSCNNEPVCVICTFSKHKDHKLQDVIEVAMNEREMLQWEMAELKKVEFKLHKLPNSIEQTKQNLHRNVSEKTKIMTQQYNEQVRIINKKIHELEAVRMEGFHDMEYRRKKEARQRARGYEEELQKLNEKYGEMRETAETKYRKESQRLNEGCNETKHELTSKLQNLQTHFRKLTARKEHLTEDNNTVLDTLLENCNQINERYESFTATASYMIGANNKWKDVQCMPTIRAACRPLRDEIGKECPQLESLSDIDMDDMPVLVANDVTITEASVVSVDSLPANGWPIDGMTCCENGNIVVTGSASNGDSHITVINRRGEIQRQDHIKGGKQFNGILTRDCCYLSDFKVATVSQPDEIGIYDVRDGHFHRKYINDVCNWSDDIYVLCVTTDPVSKRILVGTNSRYVLIFDDRLNYSHTISLPDVINESCDMIVHEGTLVVCDNSTRKAYAVTTQASGSRIICKLKKPSYPRANDLGPEKVCEDNNGFIYMLWYSNTSDQHKGTVAQYSTDGRQLLRTMNIDNSSVCLVAVDNFVYDLPSGEKQVSDALLIATYNSGKLYQYNLTRYGF